MAKRPSIIFFCKQCGHETHRWEGKCPGCHEWDTLVEAPSEQSKSSKRSKANGSGDGPTRLSLVTGSQPKPLREHAREKLPRIPVPLAEFHRVLGGGIVPGGSVLVGGEPGIGKSTLLLQLLATLVSVSPASEDGKHGFLYITGEEAPSQIAARGLRLAETETGNTSDKFKKGYDSDSLKLASETSLATILEMLESERPRVAVIDSVQTLRDDALSSAPGSVSQVRECAMALVDAGRQLNVAIFLIGHVTKDGTIAGPRVLEHVVDTVLNFEGEPRLDLRVLRASKNRFGSTDEAGFFEMTPTGLNEVPDPSAALLDRDGAADKGTGSAVGALCEGTRVLLVELQGLTVPVPGGGSPRRKASGVDANRLAQILAVLEAKASVPFGMLDVFASAAGGFRIDEPAGDLPLALALASVATGRPVRERLVAAGEVGLGGEIRPIARVEARIAEARRLGFQSVLLPARGRSALPANMNGVKILRARTLREALLLGLS
jgi:DNA repair protein RadA/Sms